MKAQILFSLFHHKAYAGKPPRRWHRLNPLYWMNKYFGIWGLYALRKDLEYIEEYFKK